MNLKLLILIIILLMISFTNEGHLQTDLNLNQTISLTKLSEIDTIGQARDVVVKNGIAFVSDMGQDYDPKGGLYIFNVSNPEQPSQLSYFYDGGRSHQLRLYNDTILLVGDNTGGLEFFNVGNPSNPMKIADFTGANYINGFAIRDNIVFATSFTEGLIVIDISNITQPRELTRLSASNIQPITLYNNIALVSGLGGLYIFNISDYSNITELKKYNYEISDFYIDSELAYTACSGSILTEAQGFKIFNISDPMNILEISSFQDGGHPVGISLVNNYVFIADYNDGVKLFDISNNNQIEKINSYTDNGNAFDLHVNGDLLFVADGFNGLVIYKIHFPSTSNTIPQTSPGFSVIVVSLIFLFSVKIKKRFHK